MEDQNQIQVFSNGHFRAQVYRDANDVIQFEAEDVARCLGITTVAKSGNVVIRWARFNSYIAEIQASTESEIIKQVSVPVKAGDYIPEDLVYRLAMKANNENANKFQDWLASDVVPSVMHTGSYTLPEGVKPPFAKAPNPVEKNLPLYFTDSAMLCIYVHAMSDDSVKIGKSNNFRRRAREIKRETELNIIDSYRTGYLPSIIADEIEKICHRNFDFYRIHGEYFRVNFVDACAEVSKRTRTIIEMHRKIYGIKWPDTNAEYDRFLSEIPDSPLFDTTEILTAAPTLSLPLPPKERLEAFFKCAEMAKSDAFRDEILRMIIEMLAGKKI